MVFRTSLHYKSRVFHGVIAVAPLKHALQHDCVVQPFVSTASSPWPH